MKYDELDLLIGQMFIFGFHEQEINTKIVEHYQSIPVGGIILFRRNIKNVEQVKRLTSDLRELANTIRPREPLLIAVDQEGGNLSPLRDLVTSLPGKYGFGCIW
jgi:beta-N-acetylhexosaminidase